MNTLFDLSRWATRTRDNLKEEVNRYTQKYAENLLFELVTRTPADTSTALSNWIVNIGSAGSVTISAYYEGMGGDTKPESARAAHDAGRIVLSTRRQGETIYISNLIEYIVSLDQGTSRQAPYGIVILAKMATERRMKGVKIKLV